MVFSGGTGSFWLAFDSLSPGWYLWLVPNQPCIVRSRGWPREEPLKSARSTAIPRKAGSTPACLHRLCVCDEHSFGWKADQNGQCWRDAMHITPSSGPLHVEELCEGTDGGSGVGTRCEQPQHTVAQSRRSPKMALRGGVQCRCGVHNVCR